MKKGLIGAAIVLAALSIGWIVQNRLLLAREGEWVAVEKGDLVLGVETTGALEATDSNRIGPPMVPDQWRFRISMIAPEGAEVKAGQPVLGFDTSELQKTLELKTAERDSARKEIEKARADTAIRKEQEELALAKADAAMRKAALKLESPLEIQGLMQRQQIQLEHDLARTETYHRKERLRSFAEAARLEIETLAAKEQRAAAIVEETQEKIRKMTVRAPRDGTVVYVTNWRNEKKKVGDDLHRAESAIEIPDLRSMMARGEVDEADAGKVRVGQRVAVRLDAHPDDAFPGRVSSIARTVQRQSPRTPLKVLKIDIALDRTDPGKMRPGMRFRGRLETGRAKDVVLIPHEAVFTAAEGPVAVRRTIGGRETVPLKLGRRNDEQIEVLEGLRPGDRVLLKKAGETEKEKES
ncbi:MAG TPA: efflux RND transporter periplasmic adaptor subunit [Thermoanaerobaculia bacterium]